MSQICVWLLALLFFFFTCLEIGQAVQGLSIFQLREDFLIDYFLWCACSLSRNLLGRYWLFMLVNFSLIFSISLSFALVLKAVLCYFLHCYIRLWLLFSPFYFIFNLEIIFFLVFQNCFPILQLLFLVT